jgi:hypothetical protein
MARWGRRVCGAAAIATSCVGGAAGAEPQIATDWKIFNVAETNDDAMSDLLWVDEATDRITVTLMRGTHVLATGSPIGTLSDGCCEAVTAADFNHDGYSDVVWTNPRNGTMHVWLLRGTQLLAAGPDIPGPPGAGWVVGNAADTNGDGLADAVWYNATTNRVAVYLMNGTKLLAAGPEMPGPPGEGWRVTNVSDTNDDAFADIVWDNPKRNTMAVWLMDGTRVLAAGPEIPGPPGEGWSAVTAADFNHDGYSDVIWTNEGRGTMAVWLLRGTQLLAAGPEIPGPGGSGWAIVYAGDTNGDGMADAVWQKSGTTQFAVWLMNGTKLAAAGPVLVGP